MTRVLHNEVTTSSPAMAFEPETTVDGSRGLYGMCGHLGMQVRRHFVLNWYLTPISSLSLSCLDRQDERPLAPCYL